MFLVSIFVVFFVCIKFVFSIVKLVVIYIIKIFDIKK